MGTVSFSYALDGLKAKLAVKRESWEEGKFMYLVPAASYPAQTGIAKQHFKDSLVPYDAYIALKEINGRVSFWTPTMSDLLSEDWIVLKGVTE